MNRIILSLSFVLFMGGLVFMLTGYNKKPVNAEYMIFSAYRGEFAEEIIPLSAFFDCRKFIKYAKSRETTHLKEDGVSYLLGNVHYNYAIKYTFTLVTDGGDYNIFVCIDGKTVGDTSDGEYAKDLMDFVRLEKGEVWFKKNINDAKR